MSLGTSLWEGVKEMYTLELYAQVRRAVMMEGLSAKLLRTRVGETSAVAAIGRLKALNQFSLGNRSGQPTTYRA